MILLKQAGAVVHKSVALKRGMQERERTSLNMNFLEGFVRHHKVFHLRQFQLHHHQSQQWLDFKSHHLSRR